MYQPISSSIALLRTIAELRASGKTWETVAERMGVPLPEVEGLVCEHALAFDKLIRTANREFLRETNRATLAALRELLKSTKESVALRAAVTIIRYDLARQRQILQARAIAIRDGRSRFKSPAASLPHEADQDSEDSMVLEEEFEADENALGRLLGRERQDGSPVLGQTGEQTPSVVTNVSTATETAPKSAAVTNNATTGSAQKTAAVTIPAPPPPAAAPGSLQAANPVAQKHQPSLIDAIRRKRWHLPRPAQTDAMDQHTLLGMAGGNKRRLGEVERLVNGWLTD